MELDRLWKLLLLNHFHDIAPGSSIARVHQRAEQDLAEVCQGCDGLLQAMLGEGEQVVYNPYSWPIRCGGVEIAPQSCSCINENTAASGATVSACEEGWVLENSNLRCVINQNGELVSVKKPGSDTEYLAGTGNRFLMFKDVNTCYDAWELGSMYENLPVALDAPAQVRTFGYEWGVGLLVERQLGESKMSQLIVLGHDDVRLDFSTRIDWQEKHKILKVAFPVNVYANDAYFETQFGYVKRPVHRSYQTDKDRYEVCNHRYTALADGANGAAVLNDGKYGVNVVGSEIRLTLLKAAMMPDQNADRGDQEFIYAFYPFDGAFQDSDTVRQAAQLNEGAIYGSQSDDLGPIFLGDQKNIIVETIKPADTVENALLVRAYECMGMKTTAAFTAAKNITKIVETDMLEENPKPVDLDKVAFGAFEIKTFLLYL
jgi:alpha-mannosidase